MSAAPLKLLSSPDVPAGGAERESDAAVLAGLPDSQRSRLAARLVLVHRAQEIADRSAADADVKDSLSRWLAEQRLAGVAAPSLGQLYRWLAAYRSLGAIGLVDRRGRPSGTRHALSADAWDHFKTLWLAPQRRSVALCWELTQGRAVECGWSWPPLHAVRERVRRELPEFHADYYRLGKTRWERKHAPAIERPAGNWRPHECWIGDHRQLDFLCADPRSGKPVRPWATAWMDAGSRYFVGVYIHTNPNSDTILAALRGAIREHGAPQSVIIDNGKDYRATALSGGKKAEGAAERCARSVLGQLGVAVHFARAYNPGAKPIESNFRTLSERFDKLMPTYIGHRPDARPEDLYEDLRRANIELSTLEQVRETFSAWLAGDYHLRPHSALDGRTPADAITIDPVAKRTAPAALLDQLLMRSQLCRVSRHGVRVNNLHYGQGNPALLPLHGQDVLVRSDPIDASAVLVCQLDGRVICEATDQRLSGATQDDVREAARRRKQARRIAEAAGPAFQDLARQPADLIADLKRRHAAEGRLAATGTDCDRPLSLIAANAPQGARPGAASRGAAPTSPLDALPAAPLDSLRSLGLDEDEPAPYLIDLLPSLPACDDGG